MPKRTKSNIRVLVLQSLTLSQSFLRSTIAGLETRSSQILTEALFT